MIKVNTNQIKRFYAFVKENIVTMIVIIAILLCAIFTILIIEDKETSSEDENFVYEDVSNQRFGISNLHSLDPIASTDRDTYHIDKLIFNGLFKLENDRSLKMDLAKEYKCDKAKGTVQITIQDNVKFHQGETFTPADVIYTYEYICSMDDSPYYQFANKIESIEAMGSNSIMVKFKSPKDASLSNLTFPILKEGQGDFGKKYSPNGTGQYKISKYNKSKYIELKPNKDYYGDVATNKLYFQIFPKSTVVENLLTSYEVTALVDFDYNKTETTSTNGVTCEYIPSNNFDYVGFNFKNKALENVELRQAIAYTVDLNEVVADTYGQGAMVSDSIYFPGYLGTENTGDPYKPNSNKAIKLIDKIKLSDKNKDGFLDDEDGDTIELDILVNKNDAHRVLFANSLSESLNELQIKNNIVAVSWKTYSSYVKKGEFDILIGGYQANYSDNLRFMFDKHNNINFKDKNIVEMVDNLNRCDTVENYNLAFTQLKNKLIEELPYYCICYKRCALLGSPKMNFEEYPNYDNVYKGVSTWQFKKIIKEE